MNNLVQCKACTNLVSKDALVCPKCGKKLRMGTWKGIKLAMKISVLGIIIFSIVLAIRNKERPDSSTRSVEPTDSVSAVSLLKSYKNNEVAADERYKGHVVRVSGVVERIGETVLGSKYVALGVDRSMWGVQCIMENNQKPRLLSLNKGDSVVITCRVQGLSMMQVLLNDCSL